ncbi:TIR domain-containing protein [Bacillus sp. JJ722]|uniref:TIR domain-containing protein n=1 Tax=Bacillus sp. JJ722 TaxID=3122973 RepID=UPI002FFF5702
MKVFLSWSGDLSKELAIAFREWLPSVIQVVDPYVSAEDIRKGNRWSSDIARELEQSSFGLVFLTPENLDAPWIHFEAGALTKTVDRSFVSPFLFGVKNSDVKGPLTQFQTTTFDKGEILKLLLDMNKSIEGNALDEGRLITVFEKWWPDLNDKLSTLLTKIKDQESVENKQHSETKSEEVLEELLKLARLQQQVLNSPEQLLPGDYVRHILRGTKNSNIHPGFIKDLDLLRQEMLDDVEDLVTVIPEEQMEQVDALRDKINSLNRYINYLKRNKNRSGEI